MSKFLDVGHCHIHFEEPAVAVCKDCQRPTCASCRVEVRRIGTLCTNCAFVRAGLRPRTGRR
jgi:hypothetical protein